MNGFLDDFIDTATGLNSVDNILEDARTGGRLYYFEDEED